MMNIRRFENETPNELICPLTCQIYLNPVRLPNGTVVEDEMIQGWIVKNHSNPFTRARLLISQLRNAPEVKAQVGDYLAAHPEKKEEQYVAGSSSPNARKRCRGLFDHIPPPQFDVEVDGLTVGIGRINFGGEN